MVKDYEFKVSKLGVLVLKISTQVTFTIIPHYPNFHYVIIKLTNLHVKLHSLLYSRKIWRGIKFGSLAVFLCNYQIKIYQNFLLTYIHTAILYRTAKLKSANIFAMAIWDPTAKFFSHQYFRLYGMIISPSIWAETDGNNSLCVPGHTAGAPGHRLHFEQLQWLVYYL